MFYITLIIGLIFSFAFKDQIKATKIYTALLLLLSAFRYGIGADYFAYMYLYKSLFVEVVPELQYGRQKQEAGFRALGSLMKTLGANYQVYLTVLALVSLYCVYKISIKYSKNPMLSMTTYYAFYYFVWTLSSLRQGLAMAVGMYFLLEAINNKRWIAFIIISILLYFIHTSSLILLIMYLLAKYIPWNKKRMIIAIVASIVIAFIPMGEVVLYLSQYVDVLKRIASYLDGVFTIQKLLSISSLARLILMGGVLFYYDELVEDSPMMKNIVHIYLISFIIYFVFQFSEITAARLSIYGRVLDFIILPSIIYLKVPKINKNVVIAGLVLFICIYFAKELNTMKLQSGLVTKETYYVSYSSIFNKEERYYNTQYHYVLFFKGATMGYPKNFHMIQ